MAGNPLLALAVETPDIGGSFIAGQQQAQTQKAARLSSMIQQYQLSKAQQADEQQNQLSQLYQAEGAGIASGDENSLAKLAGIDPGAAIETRGKLATQAASAASASKSKFDLAKEQLQEIGAHVQAVSSAPPEFQPMLYARARNQLKAMGVDVSNMPEQFDPAYVKQQGEATLTALQQLELHQKQLDAQNAEKDKVATLGETIRHNKAGEGQAGATLAETKTHNRATEAAANPFGQIGTPGAAPGQPQVTGDEFLSTLPPALAGQVKMLAEGKLAIPTGNALRAPYWQQLLQAAHQYDPSIDQASAPARFKTRSAFSSGPEAKVINNLNTAIGHAGNLLDQIGGTYSGPSPMLNAVGNFISTQTGSPGVPLFKDTAGKLAQELTAVYRGSGGAEKDVVRGLESLNENASDAQKHAILKNAVDLLDSKMDSLGDQYNRGMGTTKDPLTLLNPHAAATLQKLRGGGKPAETTGAAKQGPPIGTIERGHKFLGGDPSKPESWQAVQ